MGPLARLGQLLRVAQEHEVGGSAGDCQDVGQGELAGLVDDERVNAVRELFSGPQPCGPGHDVQLTVLELGDELAVVQRLCGWVEKPFVAVGLLSDAYGSVMPGRLLDDLIEEISYHGM